MLASGARSLPTEPYSPGLCACSHRSYVFLLETVLAEGSFSPNLLNECVHKYLYRTVNFSHATIKLNYILEGFAYLLLSPLRFWSESFPFRGSTSFQELPLGIWVAQGLGVHHWQLLIVYSSIAAYPDHINVSSLSWEDMLLFRTFHKHSGDLCLGEGMGF